jgi:NADH:ubiquinone oxidoreductase subunit K
MKRSALIAAVALPHMLAAGALLTRMVVVAFASRSPEVGADAVRTIWIQTAVLTVPSLLLVIGITGLWLRRRWGWRAVAAADLILLSLIVGDWLLGGQRVSHAPMLVILLALLVPLLVPGVRSHFTHNPEQPAVRAGAVSS